MKGKGREKQTILRQLSDGLVLRRGTAADKDALVAFNTRIHGNLEKDEPDERVGAWVLDLMERPHPTFEAGDFTFVEDTHSGEIVSCLNLISQTWSYGGVPFGVGRPELVGTHPDYRNRGLVRAQFKVVHQWSAQRGEKMQAITGIPFYYRQFGYEMGLSLGGGRLGYKPHVPELEEGEAEAFHFRPARRADVGFIARLYEQACQRSLMSCLRDEALWSYEVEGKSPQNVNRSEVRIIETAGGEPVGYLAHPFFNWGPTLAATAYEVKPGVSWSVVTPSVIRYLWSTGETYAQQQGKQAMGAFGFWLVSEHPVYQFISDRLPHMRKPYAWYVRVPDLPGFLCHIAPTLEKHLAESALAGYTGELKVTFYRDGLRMVFERGRLSDVGRWKPTPHGHSGEAAFPGLTFLQLLFGYRSLDDLEYAFADCRADSDEARALLTSLFPRKASDVWPVA